MEGHITTAVMAAYTYTCTYMKEAAKQLHAEDTSCRDTGMRNYSTSNKYHSQADMCALIGIHTVKNGVSSEHQGVKFLCVTLTPRCSHHTPMSR